MGKQFLKAGAATVGALAGASAASQQVADIDFNSIGRAWPLAAEEYEEGVDLLVGPMLLSVVEADGPTGEDYFIGAARNGRVPERIEALEFDVFTSDDFYKDRDLWSDPRYFRCNSPVALEEQWGSNGPRLIIDDPASAAWGHCDRDYPREAIVSPYPFGTAKEHYEALPSITRRSSTTPRHSWSRSGSCATTRK